MTDGLCGLPHHDYPESTCTQPAGHYRRDRDPHAAPLIINGRECGAVSWGPDSEEPHHMTSDNAPNLDDAREEITAEAKGSEPRPTVDTAISDEDEQRSARRNSAAVLLARAVHGVLTPDEGEELRKHVNAAISEADTARAVARSNLRHVQLIAPELERAEAAIARVRAFLADLERAGWSQAAIARRIREALDEPAPAPATPFTDRPFRTHRQPREQ